MSDARLIEERGIFRGKVVDLSVHRVALPNGSECDLELIRHPGAAAVVPVDAEGRVLMVKQYRYATGGWLLEVPAGKLDAREAPETCAAREVEEETGYRAGRLVPLGWIWTTPGFTDEKIWLFLALDLEPGRQQLQEDEVLTLERVPLGAAFEDALGGKITDAKTVCALLRAVHALDVRSQTASDAR